MIDLLLYIKRYFNLCEFIDKRLKKYRTRDNSSESVLLHHLINEKIDNYVERVDILLYNSSKKKKIPDGGFKYKLYFLNLLINSR